ncbi:MAG: EAL domain-containing protein, partial [Lachnospiraceae bacterium]|nr:EAL domain-containing protein [Lachnospiraceae bacterium]
MQNVYSEEMMNFLESVKIADSNMDILQKINREDLKKIAGELFLARVDAKLFLRQENSAEILAPQKFEQIFFKEQVEETHYLDLNYTRFDNEKSSVRLYPWKGHTWTEEEFLNVKLVTKLITLLVSRSSMYSFFTHANLTDLMTGILNSAGLTKKCEALLEQGRLTNYTAIILNLKNYKYVNKRYGTPIGDLLLKKYARILAELVEEEEYSARFGGDNFCIVVKKEHTEELLPRLIHMKLEVEDTMTEKAAPSSEAEQPKIITVHLDARAGVYTAQVTDDANSMITHAKIALEASKRKNRDIVVCTQEMLDRILQGKHLVHMLPMAMKEGEIVPFYQPKVNISTGRLHGCEALVRWFHDGQMISPGAFIPALENEGMTRTLDLYMLEEVCKDLRKWLDEGLEPVKVSVNYSKVDLQEPELVTITKNILEKYQIDGKYIEIEITESADFADMPALEDFISNLHAFGITISMDDFGTGYSSMNLFRILNFDVVKLDKSFIDNIETQVRKDEIIMKNMIELAIQS